jgi:glucose/arabinose dehydrogenase
VSGVVSRIDVEHIRIGGIGQAGSALALLMIVSILAGSASAAGPSTLSAHYVGQDPWPSLAPGEVVGYTVRFRNTGTEMWKAGTALQVNLGIVGDDRRFAEIGMDSGWPTPDRVAIQAEREVHPGDVATFTFALRAPAMAGTYDVPLRPVVDGVRWLEDEGVFVRIAVVPGRSVVPTIDPDVVQTGLSRPWDVAFTPDGRMLVTERDEGDIRIFASGDPSAPRVAYIEIGEVSREHQIGLMSMAVDPEFERTHWLFVCAARYGGGGALHYMVMRYTLDDQSRLSLDKWIFRDQIEWHEGMHSCRIKIGPDAMIWMTVGTDSLDLGALDPSSYAGKILRVTKDGEVPADNPVWPGMTSPTYVYSIGHRNPQGLAFDPVSRRTVAAEHGPERDDEINDIVAGGNYGWPLFAGWERWAGQGARDLPPEMRGPAWASGERTIAISGIAFATGPAWGDWEGSLFGATLAQMDLRRFTREGDRFVQHEILLDEVYGRLRSVTQGPGGALYVTTDNGPGLDRIVRVTAQQVRSGGP